jgi:SGNH domain (fused to AT3 domains)
MGTDTTDHSELGPDQVDDDAVLLIAPAPARIPQQRTAAPRRAATRVEGGVIVRQGNWVQGPAARRRRGEGTGTRRRMRQRAWYLRLPVLGVVALAGTAAVIVLVTRPGHVTHRQAGPAGPGTELVAASAAQPAATGPCWAAPPAYVASSCTFGDRAARVAVALAGDSSTDQWLDTMKALAAQRNWRITTYLASNCGISTAAQPQSTPEATAGCARWVAHTMDSIEHGNYNLVLLANGAGHGDPGADPGYAAMLQRLRGVGLTVIPVPAAG